MPDDTHDTDPIASDPTQAADQAVAVATRAGLPPRYRRVGSLGAGGMGEVLLATDTQLGREVAVKRMLIEPTGPAVARFLREAKVQARLDHPAIVPVYELANDDEGRPFFVMKRLVGTTLADVLAQHTSDPRYTRAKLLRAFADACLAIELAHSRDVIHRDLKPANIMLGDFGEVYVLDWGIARVAGETDPTSSESRASAAPELTQVGALIGTPGFMAPEMIRGDAIDHRADVFALGGILFEILAGQALLPRGREGIAAAITDYDPHPAARVPDRDIPPELDAACAAAAAQDRDTRPSARALAERIEQFLDGDRDLAQRKKLAFGHLEAARAARASGDGEAERSLAMREAGRALALDPSSGAVDLLGRLMLEPPKQIPREVEKRLTALDERATRTKAGSFFPAYIAALAVLPVLIWMGLHTALGITAYIVAILLNIASTSWAVWRSRRAPNVYVAAVTNAILIAVTTRMFGPVLIAPGIAITSMVMFATDPRLRLWLLAALTIVPAVVPLVLEIVGVTSHSLSATGGDLVVHSSWYSASMPSIAIAIGLYTIAIVWTVGFAARRIALNERAALRSVELQAWHLRQLVR
jgi:serine/threonine protein kinase